MKLLADNERYASRYYQDDGIEIVIERQGKNHQWYPRCTESQPEDLLNALDAEAKRLRALAGLAKTIRPHVQRWVENLDYEYEAEAWLAEYDVLTASESGEKPHE